MAVQCLTLSLVQTVCNMHITKLIPETILLCDVIDCTNQINSPRILDVMGPEKPGIFLCHGTVGRGLVGLQTMLVFRRQQRGTDHITQQKIHYTTQINPRENFIMYMQSITLHKLIPQKIYFYT